MWSQKRIVPKQAPQGVPRSKPEVPTKNLESQVKDNSNLKGCRLQLMLFDAVWAVPRHISSNMMVQRSCYLQMGLAQSESDSLTTCGAVLIDRMDAVALMFGMEINRILQEEWRQRAVGKRNLLMEAEMLPVQEDLEKSPCWN